MTAARPATIHGCALVIGETGVLIRGRSGSGKSSLVMALLEAAAARGVFARLVADDRVILHAAGDRLIAAPHPTLAGLVEQRGSGIVPLDHEKSARVACVIDLVEGGGDRMPLEADSIASLEGVPLRRVVLPSEMPIESAARRILAFF
jgi:serine kinase of HPr protein (carbohydrate metabolism regulator)